MIFLVDMNAFFISCEASRNPALRGVPAAVAGDPARRSGIILAANYEARASGVRTTMTLREALALCPSLVLVPPDHRFYSLRSRAVMELLGRYSPVIEQNSIDEAWLDMTGCGDLFGTPRKAAENIQREIEEELGLWCSVGIAENKFLSKMASDMKKPKGITELWQDQIVQKLWPLPVEAMYGIGEKTAEKLKGIGLYTIGDLASCAVEMLSRRFGRYGLAMHELANGIDSSPVTPHSRNDMKSIGRSATLPEDITDFETAKKALITLAEEVGADARRHGKSGSTVQITIRYADFHTITRQTAVPPTCLTADILKAGIGLLKRSWNPARPVRLLGIGITGFAEENGQLSLFDLRPDDSGRMEKLEKTVDSLRSRFGGDTIRRAALMDKKGPKNS